jgi:crotonobetainyl-CoA:carnitine CoA-transferase CaiB-like acyl-CoA transferase
VVNDVAAAFGLAQGFGLDPVIDVVRDDGTSVRLTRNPISMSATPPSYRTAPPRLADHAIADRGKDEGADG